MDIFDIAVYFESKVAQWAQQQTPAIPVSYENVTFTKPINFTPFVEVMLLPNVTMNRQVDGTKKTLLGFCQINVWTANGSGMGLGRSLAGKLIDLFPMVPKSGILSIESTPTAEAILRDSSGGWIITPVLIKYRCESSV